MRKILFALVAALTVCISAMGQRDRRGELQIRGYTCASVSESGRLWLGSRRGDLFTAKDIHSTWRRAHSPENDLSGSTLDCIAAFGGETAVVAGFIHSDNRNRHYDFVLRTTSVGLLWDTIVVDPAMKWVEAMCVHADGRLWIGSHSGRDNGVLAYSDDRGASFRVLLHQIDTNGGINTIHMSTADSGLVGNLSNRLAITADNWRTYRLLPTPMDQGLVKNRTYQSPYINRVRLWGNWMVVTQDEQTFFSSLQGETRWQEIPINHFEVDSTTGLLWAVSDSGDLRLYSSPTHYSTIAKEVGGSLIGVLKGKAYLLRSKDILRISTEGLIDTCGFYTTEEPIEDPSRILPQGNRLWGTDGSSILLLDSEGWYRVALAGRIRGLNPDPDSAHRILFIDHEDKTFSVDTAGHIAPYTYRKPFAPFLLSGIAELTITTYASGCFHYQPTTVTYRRQGSRLVESYNSIDTLPHPLRSIGAARVEQALATLGERYSLFPTPNDFGLEDGCIDLHNIFSPGPFRSTSTEGYHILIKNSAGDTLFCWGSVSANNEFDGSTRFPWLLPMHIGCREANLATHQPILWQTLRELMPDSMMLRNQLDNSTLRPRLEPQTGDLVFFYGYDEEEGMEDAIKSSTGQYTHVAILEVDQNDRLWLIEATPGKGVQRKELRGNFGLYHIDLYRLTVPFDTAAVLERAKALVGKPYDEAFLPDNDAYYCSELVQVAFDTLFPSQPMNWRDANGKLPKYWKKHFKKLKMKVPEGVPGTNPTDLSRSPLLRKL